MSWYFYEYWYVHRAIKVVTDYFSLLQNIFEVSVLLLNILTKIIPGILHEMIKKKREREKIRKRYQNKFQSINLVNSDRLLRSNDTMNNSISRKLRGSTTVKWIKFKHVQTLLYWWFGRQVFLSSFSLPLFPLSFFFFISGHGLTEKKSSTVSLRGLAKKRSSSVKSGFMQILW